MDNRHIVSWVPLSPDDLKQVNEIADIVHTDLPERNEVFAEKLTLYPSGCWKLISNERLMGYGIAHPWMLFDIPPLDAFLHQLPLNADCIYIHDVVVLPEARGQCAAKLYLDIIRKNASTSGIEKIACVSVYGTDALWARFGFQMYSSLLLSSKLQTYGSTAKYMIADVNV